MRPQRAGPIERRAWDSAVWVAAPLAAGAILSALPGMARGNEAFSCALADSRGVSESDARTAADLTCDALRRASEGRGTFEIRLAALGEIVFVTATRRQPAASETVRIDAIEGVPVAAERLAEALVHGQSLATSSRAEGRRGRGVSGPRHGGAGSGTRPEDPPRLQREAPSG